MKNQPADRSSIQGRIYQAKTVEELLAIAVAVGEPLTQEDAATLLQEIERERAMETQGFAAEEDLPDEALAGVAGGGGCPSHGNTCKLDPATELTFRRGNDVVIYFSSGRDDHFCKYWNCIVDGAPMGDVPVSDGIGPFYRCSACSETVSCDYCQHRSAQGGGLTRDFCRSPQVRALHGLT